jgi:hypothetical protein
MRRPTQATHSPTSHHQARGRCIQQVSLLSMQINYAQINPARRLAVCGKDNIDIFNVDGSKAIPTHHVCPRTYPSCAPTIQLRTRHAPAHQNINSLSTFVTLQIDSSEIDRHTSPQQSQSSQVAGKLPIAKQGPHHRNKTVVQTRPNICTAGTLSCMPADRSIQIQRSICLHR